MNAAFLTRATFAGALLLGLSACTMAPRHERPPAPVADAYPGAIASDTADAAAPGLGWREVFLDERLRTLVELALENNRDLRVAVLNVEAARAQYRIQRSEAWPTLAVSAEGTRQRLPEGAAMTGVAGQYTAGVGLAAFEIDLFGRVRSLREASLAQFLATTEAQRAVQIALVSAIATADLAERAARERLELVEQSLVAWEETGRLADLRFEAGVGSELQQVEARTLVQTARADRAAARRQAAEARNLLERLVGTPLPVDLPAGGALTDAAVLADLPAGLPSELIARRPDILAAERRLEAANANIGAARAAFFPRLSLTGFLGSASSEFSGLFESGTRTWLFSPQLTAPIFDAGRNRANLDLAWVRRDTAVAEYEIVIQDAFREVADALAGREALTEQATALEALADASRRRESLVELRFESGVDSSLALLDARRARYAAEQRLLQLRLEQLTNRVDLYRALGGGWSADSPQAPADGAGGGHPDATP